MADEPIDPDPRWWRPLDPEVPIAGASAGDLITCVPFRDPYPTVAHDESEYAPGTPSILFVPTEAGAFYLTVPGMLGPGLVLADTHDALVVAALVFADRLPGGVRDLDGFYKAARSPGEVPGYVAMPELPWPPQPRCLLRLDAIDIIQRTVLEQLPSSIVARLRDAGRKYLRTHIEAIGIRWL
jgi:hypothetical protein